MGKAKAHVNERGELVILNDNNGNNKLVWIVVSVVCAVIAIILFSNSVQSKASEPRRIKDVADLESGIQSIRNDVEAKFDSIYFYKGAIYTSDNKYDTWLMSAEILNPRLGERAYIYKDSDGDITRLYVPVHFDLHIKNSGLWNEDYIEDMVGYWEVKNLTVRTGVVEYSLSNMWPSVYFTNERVMSEKLSDDGYSVSSIPFI